jgi:hypothetical protein
MTKTNGMELFTSPSVMTPQKNDPPQPEKLLINRGNYLVVVIDVGSLDRYFLAGYRQLICDCLDKVLLDNHA